MMQITNLLVTIKDLKNVDPVELHETICSVADRLEQVE